MIRRTSLPIYLLIITSIAHNFGAACARRPSSIPTYNTKRQINTNPNGSTYLWLLKDEYSGQSFFNRFDFYDQSDPTHGQVNYVNESYAFSAGLAYVAENGTVIMKGDDTTNLSSGVVRDSVRISSQAKYTTGLFILDLNRAPWGCGVWPAFWTVGDGNWPDTGEIDIIEGVHDNEHNQVTWHTTSGCYLTTPPQEYTGTIVATNGTANVTCNGLLNDNAGCAVVEWSRASYGPYFDAQGGGVFAMKWDENGIAVWSFYRAAVPRDIVQGTPDPANWGLPVAELSPQGCDPLKYFANHSVIFDITFCGDWAGNSYATSGCPGTCRDRLMNPNNFVNASWSINSLKVYKKQLFSGPSSSTAVPKISPMWFASVLFIIISSLSML
ncbi:hypothetical protein APHAL10511_006359 [Amanita phalloides]|nr:hypothetical protein APHAL10511_006359 [Amanita phalloides]